MKHVSIGERERSSTLDDFYVGECMERELEKKIGKKGMQKSSLRRGQKIAHSNTITGHDPQVTYRAYPTTF